MFHISCADASCDAVRVAERVGFTPGEAVMTRRPRTRTVRELRGQSLEDEQASSHPSRRCRLPIMDTTAASRPTSSRRSKLGSSRAGGVPTTLPTDAAPRHQQTTLAVDRSCGERLDIAPGVIVVSGWLSPDDQQMIVERFRL